MPEIMKGVNAAVLTPMNKDLTPDLGRMADHCRWLLDNGCDGLGILGTSGEAQSFSVRERMAILEGMEKAGIPMSKAMPGTGAAAYVDTTELTRHAVDLGASGTLVLPPFYLKGVSDDGIFAAFDKIIEGVGSSDLRIYLYHFPQMSGVPLSLDLVERLAAAFPNIVVGAKDSSGDVSNMLGMVKIPGFAVFPGSEAAFLEVLQAGGAGCITAGSNLCMEMCQRLYTAWTTRGEVDEEAQRIIVGVRNVISSYPLWPGLKALMARHSGHSDWENIRPTLMPLDDASRAEIYAAFDEIGYEMPSL
ncbi:MAG: dihydrodipicolinate synthase family protein [Rhodospirillales bacterium]|nr:dihydrodipicolinate synthase family protein [Rhodospirillales bacterium]MBT5521903.1 dihydrodipicolinate synthase family protein [Rhodospirillales bacterium]